VYADAVRSGEEVLRPYCLYDLALAECSAGNLREAEELAREAIDAARDAEDTWAESLLLHPLALAQVWLGRAADARESIHRHVEDSERRGHRPGVARARSALGLLSLSEGEADRAARELVETVELLDEMGVANPGAIPALPDAIEALAHSGDAAGAAALLTRLEEQAAGLDSPWPWAAVERGRGFLLLSEGEADQACESLERATTSFDRLGYRLDAARAALAWGRARLRGGRRTVATEILADARGRFASMGAALWAQRAAQELERASPGRSAEGLTVTERRIARLVADGMKNRQIAEALFIGVATVEAHLTRIYRKLEIRSRSDLARLVADGSVEIELPEGA
jgi:DNA-binding CsgD family transcriptional regulator